MMDKVIIISHKVNILKCKAAQRYNISPEECHIGHIALQGMLEKPNAVNQIDAATHESETNLSVANRSMRLASAMNNEGRLKIGDCVLLMGPNSLDLAVPFYACHFNGYSMSAIDPSVAGADLQKVFSFIRPKAVFCQKANVEKTKEAFTANNLEGQIITFDGENSMEEYVRKHNGTEVNFKPALFDHSKVAAWLILTSGTTGLPKAAIIPFDILLNGICRWWEPSNEKIDITMTMSSLQWLSALVFFISTPIVGSIRLQSSVTLTPQLLITVINKYKPNGTAWTPHLLGQFLSVGNVCDLSSFKYIVIGGSAIDKPLLDKFKARCNAYLHLAYGMSELLVPVFEFDKSIPFGCTGKADEKYEYRIVDDEGKALDKPYKTGELWIRSDVFCKGYLNNPEETKALLTDDGWLKTGDIFYRDEQDYYYFVERKKLLIKYVGYWISPLQLEEVIKRHPAVEDVCVVGIPDVKMVELPVAAIIKKSNTKLEAQEIFDFLKKESSDLKQLHGGLFFTDAFPITPSGKIHRAKIRDIAFATKRFMPVNAS